MLQNRLTKAVKIMYLASISILCVYIILSVASKQSQMTMHQIIRTLANAPSTSALWNPKLYF